jgi:hypothetical protein
MSTTLVRSEIAKFLARETPEALCIRGKWGVGKTFAWINALKDAQAAKQVQLKAYSYVSLFGVNSLDELKFSIFENYTTLDDGVRQADLNTLEAHVEKLNGLRRYARIARSLPIINRFVSNDATGLVAFMSVKKQIVCIDDLERKGKNLDVNDVLGLISFLREQRDCKIILILNDEQLEGEQKTSFEKHLEKAVDASVIYQPTPIEAAAIGFDQSELQQMLARKCTTLGITNIRVMRRLLRLAVELASLVETFDQDVRNAAFGALVLFCWANDQPEEAPSIDYLTARKAGFYGLGNKDVPPKDASWNALLDDYGYGWTDEFDLEILKSIKRGYFDPDEIKKYASSLNDQVLATKADGSFEQAWRLYHDSFADNKDQVLDGLRTSFLKNAKYISPGNLDGTIRLFKELGRPEQAAELLAHYMNERNENREFFDLGNDPFASVSDEDVKAAFNAKYAETEETRDLKTMLDKLSDNWSDDVIATLAAVPVTEYKTIFTQTSGPELRRLLKAVFQFDNIINATAPMREIADRARMALREIGAQSDINRRRVKRYGINLDEPAAEQAEQE